MDYKKEYTASFVGALTGYTERRQYLNYLQVMGVHVNVRGGKTGENLSPEAYARIIRTSDININFCNTAGGIPQCKGRVWEVLCAGSMLLEQDNPITRKYLRDGIHCVYFNSPEDLYNKLRYWIG